MYDLASPLSSFPLSPSSSSLTTKTHKDHAMGAAGEVGMDEGRTGNVRRVSANSAGSFILFSCIFYGLDHCLFVFIFSFVILLFLLYNYRLWIFSHSTAFTALQSNSLPRPRLLQFCNKNHTTAHYARCVSLDHDPFDGCLCSSLDDIAIGYWTPTRTIVAFLPCPRLLPRWRRPCYHQRPLLPRFLPLSRLLF